MTILTININILKCCIDKLTKPIYNTIRFLCKNQFFLKSLTIMLAVLSAVHVNAVGASAEECELEGEIALESSALKEGLLCLWVIIGDGIELAGLSACIYYDSEALELVSAGLTRAFCSDENGFLYKESEGCVDILLDSAENTFCGRAVELMFTLKSAGTPLDFRIVTREAYSWNEDHLARVKLADSMLCVSSVEKQAIALKAHSVFGKDEKLFLRFEAESEDSCVAAGFDVTVFDSALMLCESLQTVSVMPRSGEAPCSFSFETEISQSGVFCIAIYPVAYRGNKTARGDGMLFVFSGGALIEKNSIQ